MMSSRGSGKAVEGPVRGPAQWEGRPIKKRKRKINAATKCSFLKAGRENLGEINNKQRRKRKEDVNHELNNRKEKQRPRRKSQRAVAGNSAPKKH